MLFTIEATSASFELEARYRSKQRDTLEKYSKRSSDSRPNDETSQFLISVPFSNASASGKYHRRLDLWRDTTNERKRRERQSVQARSEWLKPGPAEPKANEEATRAGKRKTRCRRRYLRRRERRTNSATLREIEQRDSGPGQAYTSRVSN